MAKERIDKIFSNLGILSRSSCKKAVRNKEILLNGEICNSAEVKVDTLTDEIVYKGERLDIRPFKYYILNKPKDCITAREPNVTTVFSYIEDKRTDLSAVGRLDKDTTGVLLITNDGDLNHRLLSKKYHVEKTYEALIDGVPSQEDISLLERGLDIGDEKPTLPAKARVLQVNDDNTSLVELVIIEGRFHQVKRMFMAIDKPVISLNRSRFGNLSLDNLLPGEYRELTDRELNELNSLACR